MRENRNFKITHQETTKPTKRWDDIIYSDNFDENDEDNNDLMIVKNNLELYNNTLDLHYLRLAYFHEVDCFYAAGVKLKDSRFRFVEIFNIDKQKRILFYCGNFNHEEYKRKYNKQELNKVYQKYSQFDYESYQRAVEKIDLAKERELFNKMIFGINCEKNIQQRNLRIDKKVITISEEQASQVEKHLPCTIYGSPGTGKTSVLNFAVVKFLIEHKSSKVIFVSRAQRLVNKFNEMVNDQINSKSILKNFQCYTYQDLVEKQHEKDLDEDDFVEKSYFINWMKHNKNNFKWNTNFVFDEPSINDLYYEYRNNCHLDKVTYLNETKTSLLDDEGRRLLHDIFDKYKKHLKHVKKFDCSFHNLDMSKNKDFRFDLLVLDEGQDSTALQRLDLYKLLKPTCRQNIIIGADPLQSLLDYMSLSSSQIKNEMANILNHHDFVEFEPNTHVVCHLLKHEKNELNVKTDNVYLYKHKKHLILICERKYYFFWYETDLEKCKLIELMKDKLDQYEEIKGFKNQNKNKKNNIQNTLTIKISPYFLKTGISSYLYNFLHNQQVPLPSAVILGERNIAIAIVNKDIYYTTKKMNGKLANFPLSLINGNTKLDQKDSKFQEKVLHLVLKNAPREYIKRLDPEDYQTILKYSLRCPHAVDPILSVLINMRSLLFRGLPEGSSCAKKLEEFAKPLGQLEWLENFSEKNCANLLKRYPRKRDGAENRVVLIFDSSFYDEASLRFPGIPVYPIDDYKGSEDNTVFAYGPFTKNIYTDYFKNIALLIDKNKKNMNEEEINFNRVKYFDRQTARYSIAIELLIVGLSRCTEKLIIIDEPTHGVVDEIIVQPIKKIFDDYRIKYPQMETIIEEEEVDPQYTYQFNLAKFKDLCRAREKKSAREWFATVLHAPKEEGSFETAYFKYSKSNEEWLSIAIKNNNHESVLELLKAGGVDLDSPFKGQIPLHTAIKNGNTQIANYLLEYGADVNCSDANNQTALHIACRSSLFKDIEMLIEKGANINCVDKHNKTPLYLLTERPNSGETLLIFNCLIDSGADANIAEAKEGKTPFLNLCKNYLEELSKPAQKKPQIKKSQNLMEFISRNLSETGGFLNPIQIFLNINNYKQFDINKTDVAGRSAWDYLEHAIAKNKISDAYRKFRTLLLDHGMSIASIYDSISYSNSVHERQEIKQHSEETHFDLVQKLPEEVLKHMQMHTVVYNAAIKVMLDNDLEKVNQILKCTDTRAINYNTLLNLIGPNYSQLLEEKIKPLEHSALIKKIIACGKLIRICIEYGAHPALDPVTLGILNHATLIYHSYKNTGFDELNETNLQVIKCYLEHGLTLDFNTDSEIGIKILERLCFELDEKDAEKYLNTKSKCLYEFIQGSFKDAYHTFSKNNSSQLLVAIRNNTPDIVANLLLNYNLNVDQDIYGYTPLQYACMHGADKVVSYLLRDLKGKVNPNKVGNEKRTPLFILSESYEHKNTSKMIKLLLSVNANPNIEANNHGLAIFNLSKSDHPLFAKVLTAAITNGFDINTKINNKTLLHLACENGRPKQVQILLAAGANPNCVDKENRTPLFLATNLLTSGIKFIILTYLLDHGANANIAEISNRKTPFLNLCNQYLNALMLNDEPEDPIFVLEKSEERIVSLLNAIKLFLRANGRYNQFNINQADKDNLTVWEYATCAEAMLLQKIKQSTVVNCPELTQVREFKMLLIYNGINVFRISMNLLPDGIQHKSDNIIEFDTLKKCFNLSKCILPDEIKKHLYSHNKLLTQIINLLTGVITLSCKDSKRSLEIPEKIMEKLNDLVCCDIYPVNLNTLLGYAVLPTYDLPAVNTKSKLNNEEIDKVIQEKTAYAFTIKFLIERGANPYFESRSREIIDRAIDLYHEYKEQDCEELKEANCQLIKCLLNHGFSLSENTYAKYFQNFNINMYIDNFDLLIDILSNYHKNNPNTIPHVILLLMGFDINQVNIDKFKFKTNDLHHQFFLKLKRLDLNKRRELIEDVKIKVNRLLFSKNDKQDLFNLCLLKNLYKNLYFKNNKLSTHTYLDELKFKVFSGPLMKHMLFKETENDNLRLFYILNEPSYQNDLLAIFDNACTDTLPSTLVIGKGSTN